MEPDDMDRMEALAAAATPGPWSYLPALILCYPDESGDMNARCTCGHTKGEHLRPSCPCWYFSPREGDDD